MTADPEQLTLDLEYSVYDHYEIELRKGTPPDDMEVVRTGTAQTVPTAINIIESWRDRSAFRDKVEWAAREVDGTGSLYGLAKGITWQIHVTPDLNTSLGE